MTIPTWNLAEGTSVSIDNLRNAGNWDDMGVYFDISRTEVRHHYHSTSARVSIDTLVELNLLPESSFTIEEEFPSISIFNIFKNLSSFKKFLNLFKSDTRDTGFTFLIFLSFAEILL